MVLKLPSLTRRSAVFKEGIGILCPFTNESGGQICASSLATVGSKYHKKETPDLGNFLGRKRRGASGNFTIVCSTRA